VINGRVLSVVRCDLAVWRVRLNIQWKLTVLVWLIPREVLGDIFPQYTLVENNFTIPDDKIWAKFLVTVGSQFRTTEAEIAATKFAHGHQNDRP